MHTFWTVSDAVELVLRELTDGGTWRVGVWREAALDALPVACTCKLLSGVALDCLWDSMLLDDVVSTASFILAAQESGEDATHRIWNYTSRVRTLKVAPWGTNDQLLRQLHILGNTPFPKLRTLTILRGGFRDTFDMARIEPLLSPTLTSIEFPHQRTTVAALPRIAKKCPHLTVVRAYAPERDEPRSNDDPYSPFVDGLSEFMVELQGLHILDVGDEITTPAWLHVARLPRLRRLSLELHRPLDLPPLSLSQPPFEVLRDLTLTSGNIVALTELLGHLTSVPLRSLELSIWMNSAVTATAVHHLFLVLVSAVSSHSLEKFTLQFANVYASALHGDAEIHRIRGETIGILSAFTQLRTVIIDTLQAITLDDESMLKVARAWSQLRFLAISDAASPTTAMISLRSLDYLARHCPKLGCITLGIDVPAEYAVRSTEIIQQRALVSLTVFGSPLAEGQIDGVAGFIAARFPNLEWLIAATHSTDEWDQVARILHGNRMQV
ncbi:hypothetical protein C8F01DRAFT_273739 [Mycena amicta]|nr:hypothetical protein C8F01DRAFT_273739 [Mycena amicta]